MARTPPARVDPFERDRGRLARYKERQEFYEGGQWLGRPRRQTRMTVNYARALVRKVVSYALPDRVGFTVPAPVLADRDAADAARDGRDGMPEREAQTALPDLVRARRQADDAQANRVETLLAELLAELDADRLDFALAIDSAVLGDGVIKVTWDVAAGRPRLTAVDPATLLAWWSPDTPTEAYRFAQHYQLPGQAIANLGWAASGALVPDHLYPVVEDWTAARWMVTVAGQIARDEPNPYGWLPYLVLPNNASGSQFWGESDLDDLIDVCRQINTRVSALADILDLAGWPITVLENVDSAEGITVGPGARWELPEGAKAYLLNLLKDGGVEQHVAYIDELRTALHDLAETPRTAFGESGRAIAGAALQVELQPLVQKVKRKRRGMESLYRRRNAMLLDLVERFGGEPVGGLRRTVPVWPPILPNDREADTRIGVQLVNAGVRSRRSVAADLGEEDPDAELERIVAEARQMAGLAEPANRDEQDRREAPGEEQTHAGRAHRGSQTASQETGAPDEHTA
jgi:hypothetical protein